MKKIVNFIVIMAIIIIGTNSVEAEQYSEVLQKVAPDKKMTINYRTPKDSTEASVFLSMYLRKNFNNISGYLSNCNEDYSECIVGLIDNSSSNNYYENTVVNITWKEEYSDLFKEIAPNNVATIKEMKPKNYDSYMFSHFNKYYSNIYGTLKNCNDDLTICDLLIHESKQSSYSYIDYEVHQVKINWQEESSDLFKKIAPNNELKMAAIRPTNESEVDFYSSAALARKYNNISGYLTDCNSDYSECVLDITESDSGTTTSESYHEAHRVKVVWEKENKIAKNLIDSAIKMLQASMKVINKEDSSVEYYHVLEDLNLINFLRNKEGNIGNDASINYVPELKLLFEYSNISYNLDSRLGDAGFFFEMGGGQLSLLYKGVIYGLVDFSETNGYQSSTTVYKNHVLYIPTNTAKTKEAYLAAAKKRLDEYLKEDVKVEVGGLIKEIDEKESVAIPHFEATQEQIGDYYYKVTINNKTYNFLIVRDTTKMVVNNVIKSIDLDSNVKLETNAPDVPSDAVLTVNVIEKDSATYNKITETLKTDLFQPFDISLYSNTLGKNITKTEKGEFKITIPVMESLKGKNLTVYYIKDDNTLEEHPVTLDEDGNATFTTNHFSTYILTEASSAPIVSNNVQTGTVNPLILSIVIVGSVIGMIYIGKSIKKELR